MNYSLPFATGFLTALVLAFYAGLVVPCFWRREEDKASGEVYDDDPEWPDEYGEPVG